MLTREQRFLLAGTDPRLLTNTILDPIGGVSAIKSRCGGGHLRRRDGTPEWLTCYDTTSKGYVGREQFGGDVRVTVTWKQLQDFTDEVPKEVKEQLRKVRDEDRAEQQRVYKWCHCHHGDPERAAACEKRNEGDPFYGGRRHPSDEEDDEHLELSRALFEREKDLLMQALGLVGEPVGQMDMFDLMGVSE